MLQLAATGVQYKDIQVQLSCAGNRVELTQLHAASGVGTLELTGWAESAGLTLRYLDLDLQMQQFTLMHTPALEAVVSAAVAVRGSLEKMMVTREVSGYVVSINVSGRARSPQLRLSSIPDLPQADIVTLLVVGKTTDRLTAAERSGLSGQAQQIVGNVAAGELEQLLAKPLGFDTLDMQTSDKLGSGKVSVGRYVTQDIFLSYERQLGDASGNKVGVEYSVNRHLKLKGSSGNTGDSALDILWRIDY